MCECHVQSNFVHRIGFAVTYNDAHTGPLSLSETLSNRHSSELDRMADVHFDLLVTLLFGIKPKVREGRLEEPSTYSIKVRYVIPLLLTSVEDLVEVIPFCDIGLHVDDVVFSSCKCVIVRRSAKIGDEDTCTKLMCLFC